MKKYLLCLQCNLGKIKTTYWTLKRKIVSALSFEIMWLGHVYQWRSQFKVLLGNYFNFKRTVLCFGNRLTRHKMTNMLESFAGITPFSRWLRLWCPLSCNDETCVSKKISYLNLYWSISYLVPLHRLQHFAAYKLVENRRNNECAVTSFQAVNCL